MHAFTDARGREWQIEITIGSARRFTRLDLINIAPDQLVTILSQQPLTRIEMAWHFCVNKDDVEQSDFEDSLTGFTIEALDKAVWDEVVFFTQNLRPEVSEQIPVLRDRYQELMRKGIERVIQIAETDEWRNAADKQLDKIKEEAISNLSTMQLESLE